MINVQIKISYMPGLEPFPGYTDSIYSCEKLTEIDAEITAVRLQEDWEDNRHIGTDQTIVQASIEQRYELIFASTVSIKTELLEVGGIVEIKEEGLDWYKAFKIKANKEYIRDIKTYINKITFSKHEQIKYIDYLTSNHVKDWNDLISTNYANYINYTVKNTPYTQRSAGVNDTIATLDYNFKFELNDETSQITVGQKYYAFIPAQQIRTDVQDKDYRCEVVYIDSNYIYFKFTTIPIQTFSETEIQVTGEPYGEDVHGTPTANEFEGKIYTFLRPKLTNIYDGGETFEQINGIQQQSNIKMQRRYKVEFFLKPEEDYLYQKLMECDPKDVYFSDFDKQGNETKYYPITMTNLALIKEDSNLKDLNRYEMLITFNNETANVFRETY